AGAGHAERAGDAPAHPSFGRKQRAAAVVRLPATGSPRYYLPRAFKDREKGCVMSLLVVGSVALDSVETPTDRRDNVLGGSAVFFSYAASYFTPVSLVGVVGEDWPAEHTTLLQRRNID